MSLFDWVLSVRRNRRSSKRARQSLRAVHPRALPQIEFLEDRCLLVVNLSQVVTGLGNPIGIDYHVTDNRLLVSLNWPDGQPHNFELIGTTGPNASRTQFTNVSGFADEIKVATVRNTLGGFAVGEAFTGTGVPGRIARISPNGATVQTNWVTLPGETLLLRGGLHVDRTGVFGGDLIVVTGTPNVNLGRVWRVNSAGAATLLATVNTQLEGVTTVPNDPVRYGPWAGKILAGGGGGQVPGPIFAIAPNGTVTSFNLSAGGVGIGAEDLDLITGDFFGVDEDGTIWKAPASEFAGMIGDILVTQEINPAALYRVRWNGAAFDITPLPTNIPVRQWEHVTFDSPIDLSLTKVVNNPTPQLNGLVTYTLTVSNANDVEVTATGVQVTERAFPAGLQFVSAATPSQGTFNSGTLVWTVGSLAPGASATLQITARVTTLGTKINTAEVTSAVQRDRDSTPNNNVPTEDDQASAAVTPQTEVTGSEGLTPGFWKNNAVHHDAVAWGPTGFSPNQTLGSVFIRLNSAPYTSLGSMTLLQGLGLNGGGVNALLRHAVAAVLNAAHPLVNYPLTVSQIIQQVNAALDSQNATLIETLKNQLDAFNNLGAPLDQQGRRTQP